MTLPFVVHLNNKQKIKYYIILFIQVTNGNFLCELKYIQFL